MQILYKRGNNTYIVKNKGVVFYIQSSSNKISEIDDIIAQELLRSGYWDVYIKDDNDKKIREEISSLIHSI